MSKKTIFPLVVGSLLFSGCFSGWAPWIPDGKLKTVISAGESVDISNGHDIVTVESISPTKRRIWYEGEYRDINLLKTYNGIYTGDGRSVSIQPPIGNIKRVVYLESIRVFESSIEYIEYVKAMKKMKGVSFSYNGKMETMLDFRERVLVIGLVRLIVKEEEKVPVKEIKKN